MREQQTFFGEKIVPEAYAQQAIMAVMADGQPRSTRQLMRDARISDPRAIIRTLRDKGIDIVDEWQKNSHGIRYKIYWINKHNL